MASGLSNAFYHVQDRGSTLVLASLVTLTVAVILAIARVGAALSLRRDAGPEHMLSVAANVLAVVQTATVVMAVKHGIGRHQDELIFEQVSQGSKYRYASQILFIAVVALTKFAMTNFFRRLTQRQSFIRVCNGMHDGRSVKMDSVLPAGSTSLVSIRAESLKIIQADFLSDDSTWSTVPFMVYTQLGQNLSLIVTTVPFLHRLGASLHTGRFGNNAMVSEDMRMTRTGYGQTSVDGSSGHIKLGRVAKGTQGSDAHRSGKSAMHTHARGLRPASNLATISSMAGPSESQENLTGLEGGILQTTRVTVENTARSMDSGLDR
ncbi:hypothetical protein B0A48_14467 [Cryoendolithus antarcticus]|uniref:Rhodopsin domain-containing protein n=1 Tax=Cryoendolithus antarcticus TaxID=1507870 RepID=A0A1V8SKY9_9PEZI|nr:hypothetical protein B0A48_14467 [Cryoendolithus antarcticus]